MDSAEQLVEAARERRPQRMTPAERRAAVITAVGFLCAAPLVCALAPYNREIDPLLLVALTIGYALISRVEFEIGAGYAVPEALLFVPLLFVVPLPLVPVMVVVAFVLGRIPEFITRKAHWDRWLYAVSDAWFSLGPVIVIGLLAPGDPALRHLDVYVLAFVGHVGSTVAPVLVHERLGKGVSLRESMRALAWSYRMEGQLWPVGLMAAFAASNAPLTLLALVPLVQLLSTFSRERGQRYEATLELNRAYRGTVMLLSDVVEADDNYTADHCRSVVELVSAVADELEVASDDRQELEFAALLHDVGKIAIPKEVLNKPAKLTQEEFELMKTHTIEGQNMLDRVGGLLGRVGRIVRSCHERWDGTGYPDGIRGEDIPLAARIVFCCDAYNAMTTNRPYRQAMPVESALAELREHAGTQFDPWVVAGLTRVIERGHVESRPTPADAVRAVIAQRVQPHAVGD